MKLLLQVLLIPLFFLVDMAFFAFFDQPIINLLLCFYIVSLLRWKNRLWLSCIAFWLFLESFIYYSSLIPAFAYLIPITVLGILCNTYCYPRPFQRYFLLVFTLLLQTLIIEPYYCGITGGLSYTLFKIFVNVIVMIPFSLKSMVI